MFRALLLNQADNQTTAKIESLSLSQLPNNEVTVAVDYSSLNYKDALAITGKGKIIRHFPMIPGIDFSGTVVKSLDSRYNEGDEVILTGWGVGESYWGGLAEKACVKGDWLVPMPKKLNSLQAMTIGTAGLTAMLCIRALQANGVTPEKGKILVTGASGGVGSIAVTLLARLGYQVTAATGRASENNEWLTSLGATDILERESLEQLAKPLEKALWAGVVDTVGSKILAKALAQIQPNGAAAICGLAGGIDLPTTVAPFILRGINLSGIDSVNCDRKTRIAAWEQLADLLTQSSYQACQTINLDETLQQAEKLIKGQVKGRTLVHLKTN